MDMTIEAAPMVAHAAAVEVIVTTITIFAKSKVTSLIERVASISCPSIAGTSISAVSPDYILIGGTA